MLLVCGAHYGEEKATVCGSLYRKDEDVRPTHDFVVVVTNLTRHGFEDYLWKYPCLVSLFDEVDQTPDIIINYYDNPATLSPMNTVLWKTLERFIPIIGVCVLEPPYKVSLEVDWKGTPLYIVTNGMDLAEARDIIQGLPGEGTLPEAFLRIHLLTLDKSTNLPL